MPAKKQKTSKDSDGKSTKPSPKTEPLRRCWIYVIWDRRRHVIIYVGQSVDCDRRWQEHLRHAIAEDSKTGLADFLGREQTTTDMLELRLVEGLPNGVAWKDADRWEAFFISKHETVYDPRKNKRVCNKNNGNDASQVDYDAQEEELLRGYVWPKAEAAAPPSTPAQDAPATSAPPPSPAQGAAGASAPVLSTSTAIVKVPTKLDSVQGLEACMRHAQAMLGKTDAPLRWHGSGTDGKPGEVCLSMIAADCDRLERGTYAHGTEKCAKYEKMHKKGQKVRRDDVIADIASFGEWAVEGDELSQEIKRQKVGLASDKYTQFASTDNNNNRAAVPMVPAKYALGAMMMMHSRAGQFEEAALRNGTDTRLGGADLRTATAVREWMEKNDGNKPAVNATCRAGHLNHVSDADAARTEHSLGTWLANMKLRGSGARIAGVSVILRDQPAALAHFATDRNAVTLANAKALNTLLQRGFGIAKEVELGRARQVWTKKLAELEGVHEPKAVYKLYRQFLDGATPSLADVILEVGGQLTHESAAQRRAEHEANAPKWAVDNQRRHKLRYASHRAATSKKTQADAQVLNGFLRKGYGHRNEKSVPGDDQRERLTGAVLGGTLDARRQLSVLGMFMNGGCPDIADALLKDLPPPRATAIRAQHEEAARAKGVETPPPECAPSPPPPECTSSSSSSSSPTTAPCDDSDEEAKAPRYSEMADSDDELIDDEKHIKRRASDAKRQAPRYSGMADSDDELTDDEKHIKRRASAAKRRARKKAAKEAAEAVEPPPSDKAKGKRPMVEDDPVPSREDSDSE